MVLLQALDEGHEVRTKLNLARTMIRSIRGIDLDDYANGTISDPIMPQDDVTPDSRMKLRSIVTRLTDKKWLREFCLVYDGTRVKLADGTRAPLLTKDDMELFFKLAGMTLDKV